jgi:uncharacterized membrane protein
MGVNKVTSKNKSTEKRKVTCTLPFPAMKEPTLNSRSIQFQIPESEYIRFSRL